MAILEIADLHVHYETLHVLQGISLSVGKGQIVALVGSNGAGKSTTLRAASGLLPARSGEVRLEGRPLMRLEPHEIAAMGLRHMPEGRRIFGRLTVRENLEMGAFTRRDRNDIAMDKERMVSLFPRLKERWTQLAGTLSGGEQQMLAMARALMGRPRVLMMDEPSLGLSPLLVEQVFDSIRMINDEGVAILLVEQNASLALGVADVGYVMESGRITLSGAAADLLENEWVQRAYLG
jgi:branched-chain amino acid transport system ATP-binding protein